MDQIRTLHPQGRERVARAYINHGRWIVECECHEAHQLKPGPKRWRCEMLVDGRHVGCGTEYSVIWPNRKLRRQIETVLSTRPYENRNWWPWETVDQLVAENLEHGCAVLDDVLPGDGR